MLALCIYTEGIVMGGGFLIHRFFNHFLVKEHEKPAEDQKNKKQFSETFDENKEVCRGPKKPKKPKKTIF